MTCEIVKEFTCKRTSTLSSCDGEREMAFARRQFGKAGKGRKTQLDDIIGPKKASDKVHIHNDVELWGAWDDYPIYATTQEDDVQNFFYSKEH